ncbi:uncharacterized protein LOC143288149 [Babylonia areolata]|uniref:uncharacterized protein LOC143288149 n=1 Tax=Babylonia areolata TaxID=304850 RepID=UPI003FD1D6F7
MLSVPAGGGGGGVQNGSVMERCYGGGGGKPALTRQFFPNGDAKLVTATAAAAAITGETPTPLGNNPPPPLLLKPPVLSATPSTPHSTTTTTSSSLAKTRPGEDHYRGGPHPHPKRTSPPLHISAPMTCAATPQVKLTPAESHMSPTPHSFTTTPPRGNSNLDNGTTATHSGESDAIALSYNDADGDDDSVSNNSSSLIDHQGTQLEKSSPSALMTTTTKAVDAVGSGEHSGGGGGGGPVRNLRVRGQRKFLPEKTRHKRQTLQDMTRPLKQWLIRHKDNPYPSKAQKMDLVSKSQMTLTQVSNWFANARRRLKNTVKQPDLTWASRIKLYNSCVEGNAELFSLCSDDSCLDSDDDMMEHRQSDTFHDDVTDSLTSSRTATPEVTGASGEPCSNFNHGSNSGSHSNSNHHHHHHSYQHSHSSSSSNSGPSPSGPSGPHPYPGLEDSCASFPKYKHSILHRYLSDSHQQALILDEDSVAKSRDRHHSSSTGSRDFEELSTSSVSSPAHESVHHDHLDDFSEEFETMALRRRTSDVSSNAARGDDMYWKEIGAALALTSLAKGRVVRT